MLKQHVGIRSVADCLADTSASVYVVGGAIRDALLGFDVKDVDLVITGLPLTEVEKKLATIGRVDVIGKRFAVLRIMLPDGIQVDVSLPRTDASFRTGRYRDVKIHADPDLPIEHDLTRRDFTINAMAWNIASHELIDPFNGQKDLSRRVLRAVGTPTERFQEDATRILRAARFSAMLGMTIEKDTATAIKEKLPLLQDEFITPREVIAQELISGLTAEPVRMLDILDELGIMAMLIPELSATKGCAQPYEFHAEGDVWTHTRLALEALTDTQFNKTFAVTPSPQLIVTTLLHDIGKPPSQRMPEKGSEDRIRFDRHAPKGAEIAENICTRLRLASTGDIDVPTIVWLIEHHLDILNFDTMKATTIERTFLAPDGRGDLLQQLTWVDSRASLDPTEKERGEKFHLPRRFGILQIRLGEITKRGYRDSQPTPLLSGTDIMKILSISSGPDIGKAIESLRNAQLEGEITTKDQAVAFIKKQYGAHD
ncbi:MAG: HD domain-containing protein [Candidatus Kerfeldbacteria bacterium]